MSKLITEVKGTKEFLNNVGFHSIACIAYEMELNHYKEEAARPWAEGTMYITDCTRSISLVLDLEKEDSFENTLHKLDTIIAVAIKARKDAVEMRNAYIEKREKWDKKKEENKNDG